MKLKIKKPRWLYGLSAMVRQYFCDHRLLEKDMFHYEYTKWKCPCCKCGKMFYHAEAHQLPPKHGWSQT